MGSHGVSLVQWCANFYCKLPFTLRHHTGWTSALEPTLPNLPGAGYTVYAAQVTVYAVYAAEHDILYAKSDKPCRRASILAVFKDAHFWFGETPNMGHKSWHPSATMSVKTFKHLSTQGLRQFLLQVLPSFFQTRSGRRLPRMPITGRLAFNQKHAWRTTKIWEKGLHLLNVCLTTSNQPLPLPSKQILPACKPIAPSEST